MTASRSGIDLTHRNPAVRPQDDLFAHVNGKWLDTYEIPADRALDGAFRTLYDRAEKDVKALIDEAAAADDAPEGSEQRKIGDVFRSFMDTDAIAAAGLGPIQADLDAIAGAADADELAAVIGHLQTTGVQGPIGMYVNTDRKQSTRYLVYLSQSGLGLPDESYYREDSYAEIRGKYLAHITRMLTLASIPNPDAKAASILELETAIAAAHWDVVRNRDADLTYNLATAESLAGDAPGFPWQRWIGAHTEDPSKFAEVVVRQPSFLAGLGDLWQSRPLTQWQDWTVWKVLRSRAPYLTDDVVQADFEFYGTTLSGTEENRERWKRGVSLVQDLLGEAVGKLYVARHFPADAKDRMKVLVDDLTEAYRRNISELEWMSPETRTKALAKLEKFTPKVGYPDKWRDYSQLQITPTDLLANVRNGYLDEYRRELGKLGQPVDRDEWFMTPQTVNAYYNPGMNEIVFPAAILQPPFFDPQADDAANYGGIGAVIGHEIGHGFDDQGAKYDGDGNLVDWWTDSDRTEFGKRTTALIAQYAALSPSDLPGHKVNGELTIGENIGDLGGLSIALAAYRIALERTGGEPPVLDGLTGVQRVFFGWAQVWRTKARESEAIRRLAVDPHSPPEFRCNGVIRNIDEFYDAFDVTSDDALFMPEEDRVRIW